MSNKVIKAKNIELAEKPTPAHQQFMKSLPGIKEDDSKLKTPRNFSGGPERETWENLTAEESKKAYERGFSEGVAFLKKENVQTLNVLAEIIKETGEWKNRLFKEAEGQMLNLVFSVAEKVIHTEVTTNRNVVLAVLREAVNNVVDREGMKIILNPEDYRFMMEIKPSFFQELKGIKNVTFEERAEIKPGGVVLESLSGEVDARLEQQMKEIKSSMKIM